ncbi:DnaJ domain-containing protein [Coemansia erecta]|nr:DnaJ domain-containing protein [Coemansia sp. RSA 2618]KAJ2828013.1 DnaJ domain-containing protein [Coemansia erecta]
MDVATEIERILGHSVLDPFGILGVPRTCTPDDVKAAYRSKSRKIHPDKAKQHPQARPAFEKLKAAETELMDDEKRTAILNMMAEARRELSAEWKSEVIDGTRQQPADESSQIFADAAFEKYKAIMIDIEWRRRQKVKDAMAAEGVKAKREEEAVIEKRRKRRAEKDWEDSRDERVSDWRSFQAKGGKSKKSKSKKTK